MNSRERDRLLNSMVGFGTLLEQLSSEDETMAREIRQLDYRLRDDVREARRAKENRQHFSLRIVEIRARRKKLAEKVSQTRNAILKAKRSLKQ